MLFRILFVIFVIHLIYSRKKIKDLKAREGSTIGVKEEIKPIAYSKKVKYNGDALCPIDLKSIEAGENVAVLPECKHIFHYDCLKAMQEEKSFQGCPICIRVKEVETNRI